MSDAIFGTIPGSSIPQTSSLELDYAFNFFLPNEEPLLVATEDVADPHLNTGRDDVVEW